jgi:hypothetical protein
MRLVYRFEQLLVASLQTTAILNGEAIAVVDRHWWYLHIVCLMKGNSRQLPRSLSMAILPLSPIVAFHTLCSFLEAGRNFEQNAKTAEHVSNSQGVARIRQGTDRQNK